MENIQKVNPDNSVSIALKEYKDNNERDADIPNPVDGMIINNWAEWRQLYYNWMRLNIILR